MDSFPWILAALCPIIGLHARLRRIEKHLGIPSSVSPREASKDVLVLVVTVLLGVVVGFLVLNYLLK